MAKAKMAKATADVTKALSEGDRAVVMRDLEDDFAHLSNFHHDCMTKAPDFEASLKSRDAELEALATAKNILAELAAGATEIVLSVASFLQIGQT